ncbi:hypothetical protein LIER_17270 [Lithospermum erythrorhizon]|uniref:Transposase (putative) gypsy type domain-containing protein n=1 Tax=Lithospermum erythrorhizon TaxID=34254 RepID=A0AAV3QF41_LITER
MQEYSVLSRMSRHLIPSFWPPNSPDHPYSPLSFPLKGIHLLNFYTFVTFSSTDIATFPHFSEQDQPYLPLYSSNLFEESEKMTNKNIHKHPTSGDEGVIERTLEEVQLARLVASLGGEYRFNGLIPFSRTSNPHLYYSSKQICILPDFDDEDNVQGVKIREPETVAPTSVEAERFAAGVLIEPDNEDVRTQKTLLPKRKMPSGEGPKRKPKRSKKDESAYPVEGAKGAMVNDPGVKDSQTLEGFRSRTMNSAVAKGHLRHLKEHYSISPEVQMRIPLEGEVVDALMQEGFTPVFWEFFNYGMRLRASPFVISRLTALGRAPGQLGPFAWATVTTFQVGCLSVGVVPNVNLFARIFNVVHQGVLTYFHPKPGVKNVLYSEKPGKVSPTRWHRYLFFVKDAFSEDVPHKFRTDYTALEFEESEASNLEFQKLMEGFPQPLPLKTFCDPEVVIKAGLCRGPNRYPEMTLGDLLLAKMELAPIPSKVSYKDVVSGASLKKRVLG